MQSPDHSDLWPSSSSGGQPAAEELSARIGQLVSEGRMLLAMSADSWAEPFAGEIEACLHRLEAPDARLAFGGHFGCGKSTVLNLLIGRKLLPVNDLAETGALCVLRTGESDAAMVVANGARTPIPCHESTLRERISLGSRPNGDREQVHGVQRVELTLAAAPIPERVEWLDLPGVNESQAMESRAREAVEEADVLVWVLSSKQFLSLAEQHILAEYISTRGASGVLLVLNVFLETDTIEEWERFEAESLPMILNKLQERAGTLKFTHDPSTRMLIVSGRAAATAGEFGGDTFRQSIRAIDSTLHPRVCSARLHPFAGLLEVAASEARERFHRLRMENQWWEGQRKTALEATERKRALFEKTVPLPVDAFLEHADRRIRASAESVAGAITAASLDRGDEYGRELTDRFTLAVREGLGALTDNVRRAAVQYRQDFSDALWGELNELIALEAITITVARHGAEARARLFGTNEAAGAAVDRALGLGAAALKSVEKDVAEARQNARAAAQAIKERGAAVGQAFGKGADTLKDLGKSVSEAKENARAAARTAAQRLQDRQTMVGRVFGFGADKLKSLGNDLSKIRENARTTAQGMQDRHTMAGRLLGLGADAWKALEKDLAKAQESARTAAQSVRSGEAAVGRLLTQAAEVLKAFEKDVIETQETVREAGRGAAGTLKARRGAIIDLLLRHATPLRTPEEAPAPGLADEANLAGWLSKADAVCHEAKSLLAALENECDRD